MLISPVKEFVVNYNRCFGNTNLLVQNKDYNAQLTSTTKEVKDNKTSENKTLLYTGAGVVLLALAIFGGVKYFGRSASKAISTESKSNIPSDVSTSENNSIDYISKLKQIFNSPEKIHLAERNLNQENQEIFHYIVDNIQVLGLKKVSDIGFYLRSINKMNKDFVFNQLIPFLKSKGVTSAGEISDVISSTPTGNLGAVRGYIKMKEDCAQCPSFTPLEGDKGFSGVWGLKSAMLELHNKFIVPFQKKINGENSLIPNGIVLYGPDACGKAHLAKALAKQTGCRFGVLEPRIENGEQMAELMTVLEKTAKGPNNKHSICLIDNAEWFFDDKELPPEELLEIFNKCSDKYKCTFVFTFNNKNSIPKEFSSLGIENIHVPKPDYSTYHDILFKHGFEKDDIDEIILEIYNKLDKQSEKSSFATEQIKLMIQDLERRQNLSKQSLIQTIQDEKPLLTSGMLANGEAI